MQETGIINVEKRVNTSSGENKRLRHNGYIPAILYGKGIEPVPITVKKTELRGKLMKYGRNAVFNLNIPSEDSYSVVVKDIQSDPMIEDYIHVDFQQISLTEEIKANVYIKIIGREVIEAARLNAIQQIDSISVKCLPQSVPQSIEIDISKMTLGESITVGDIKLPEGVTLESDPEQLLITLHEIKEYISEDDSVKDSEEESAEAEKPTTK